MCADLLLRELQNYNSLLNNHRQEDIESHQKKISHVQGQRRSPSKMVGGAKSHLESNPIPARDAQRAQTKLYAHQETPQRLGQTCLWIFEHLLWWYGSAVACHMGRGSGCSTPDCSISPLGGGCHEPHHRAARTYKGLGKQTLGGHKQNLCAPGPRRKEQWPHKRLTQTLPVSVQKSPVEVWVSSGLLQGGGTECGSACMGPFEGGHHYLHYLHQF